MKNTCNCTDCKMFHTPKNNGYNRNLMGGRRQKKKIQRYGYHIYKTLSERMIAESKALEAYQKRTGQYKND